MRVPACESNCLGERGAANEEGRKGLWGSVLDAQLSLARLLMHGWMSRSAHSH